MKSIVVLALLMSSVCILNSCKQSDPPSFSRVLIWSDEFNGSELDENKWEVQLGTGASVGLSQWGNNEQQFYRRENITVENGFLRIRAQRENFQGMDYTSARIRSLNKGDFKFGRMEARIRMDNTPGLWHAFWMLPSSPNASWPVTGEIDIMEYVGNAPTELLNYIHFADQQGNHRYRGVETNLLTAASDFHVYAIEWDETEIVWFIDDMQTYRVTRTDEDLVHVWPFDAKFHLLLNTAVGGNLGGNINVQAMTLPRFMEVDYVRVYQ